MCENEGYPILPPENDMSDPFYRTKDQISSEQRKAEGEFRQAQAKDRPLPVIHCPHGIESSILCALCEANRQAHPPQGGSATAHQKIVVSHCTHCGSPIYGRTMLTGNISAGDVERTCPPACTMYIMKEGQ